jgi:arylsulfatase A-like enzyme
MLPKIVSLSLMVPMAISCSSKQAGETQKPNIVFLLADDMGYGEPGCYGQEIIKTPFLDSLASVGMRFTDFYAGTSVCSPSRAVLMTGKHAGHSTIRGNKGRYAPNKWYRVPLRLDELTLGDMLKTAGYQTGFIGKWHLEDPDSLETWAINRGFDYVVQEQWDDNKEYGRQFNDAAVHWKNGWTDTVLYNRDNYDCIDEFRTDIAMEYLDQKDDSKPFFLFMSYRTPHGHETYTRNKDLYAEYGWEENERRHAARITMLDKEMRRLFNRLAKDGDLENTLVIFTSDNGPTNEGHSHEFFNSNGNLRGFKRDLYEGGIREPMIVYWKDKVKQGTVSSHPSAFYDVMPTLAEVAEIPVPEHTDGISFLPELLGKEQPKHTYLYWEILELVGKNSPDRGFRQAVRMGEWKAVRYGIHGDIQLYNLKEDIGEQKDLAKENPEMVAKLKAYIEEARTPNDFFPFGGRIDE